MTYVPQVDSGACAAHGDCAVVAPDVFRVDEVAEVIGAGTPDSVVAAAEACPAAAITVIDSETGEQIYP
jgi:ferredoxin